MTTPTLDKYDPQAILAAYDPERFLSQDILTADPRPKVERDLAYRLTQAFLVSVAVVKAADWLGLAQRWQSHGWEPEAVEKTVSGPFAAMFQDTAIGAYMEALAEGNAYASANFGLFHDVAVGLNAASKVYAQRTARTMADTQARAMQDSVNDMINQRLPPPVMAERAKAMYGLDPVQAQSYARFAQNKSLSRRETLPQMLKRLLFHRGKTIGDTEAYTAINMGIQIRLQDAIANGDLPVDTKKRWVTAHDERVCPVCGPMDGIEVFVTDSFEVVMPIPKTSRGKSRRSSHLVVPPVHPNCRCAIELVEVAQRKRLVAVGKRDNDWEHQPRSKDGKFGHKNKSEFRAEVNSYVESMKKDNFALRMIDHPDMGMGEDPNDESFAFEIKQGKKTVGDAVITMNRVTNIGHLDWMKLNKGVQAQGFGDYAFGEALKMMKDNGMTKAAIMANIDVGGYAWAVRGARFAQPEADETDQHAFANRGFRKRFKQWEKYGTTNIGGHIGGWAKMRLFGLKSPYTPEQRAEILTEVQAMQARMDKYKRHPAHPKAPTPREIAAIGRQHRYVTKDGYQMWAGKEILLGATWNGMLDL